MPDMDIRLSLSPGVDQAPYCAPILEVEDITIRFGGIIALNKVSFAVPRGQICGLIGPNGAGKTTLFNCLSHIYPFAAGKIRLDGLSLKGVPRHAIAPLGIGRTFQNLAVFRTMTVEENIAIGGYCRSRSGYLQNFLRLSSVRAEEKRSLDDVRRIIDFLGLGSVSDRVISELPFAIQKRVELGRAIAAKPKLLLLDEPAAGLNHSEVAELGRTIAEVRARYDLTILLVEHHMAMVMSLCDKIVVLNFGRKIADGTPGEVRQNEDVIRAYLGNS